RYAMSFVNELAGMGVQNAVLCAGSRSAPLTMSFAALADAHRSGNAETATKPRLWTSFIDERSAGFFALGMAKLLRQPVALVCTSGTAAANFYPAIVEAYNARVPLIVLTADLPHDFRAVGANQTIDQMNMYGSHVKQFIEVAPPGDAPHQLSYARTLARR